MQALEASMELIQAQLGDLAEHIEDTDETLAVHLQASKCMYEHCNVTFSNVQLHMAFNLPPSSE